MIKYVMGVHVSHMYIQPTVRSLGYHLNPSPYTKTWERECFSISGRVPC